MTKSAAKKWEGFTVPCPQELQDQLDACAHTLGITRSKLVREILRGFVASPAVPQLLWALAQQQKKEPHSVIRRELLIYLRTTRERFLTMSPEDQEAP